MTALRDLHTALSGVTTFDGAIVIHRIESESEAAHERDMAKAAIAQWQQDYAHAQEQIRGLRVENAFLERDNAQLTADLTAVEDSLIDAGNTAFELARGQEDMADIISDQREEIDWLRAWIESQLQCYPQRVILGMDPAGLQEDPLLGSVDTGQVWVLPEDWQSVGFTDFDSQTYRDLIDGAVADMVKHTVQSWTIPLVEVDPEVMRLFLGTPDGTPYADWELELMLDGPDSGIVRGSE